MIITNTKESLKFLMEVVERVIFFKSFKKKKNTVTQSKFLPTQPEDRKGWSKVKYEKGNNKITNNMIWLLSGKTQENQLKEAI